MTPEHLQIAIDLYRGGLTLEQLAARMGYGRSTICREFRSSGVKCRAPGHPQRTEEQVLRAIDLYAGGETIRKAGKIVGVGYDTLRAEFVERGVKIREAGRRIA
jgi:transposase